MSTSHVFKPYDEECTVCHCTGETLPTECPGEPVPAHVQDDIHKWVLDYRAGRWWRLDDTVITEDTMTYRAQPTPDTRIEGKRLVDMTDDELAQACKPHRHPDAGLTPEQFRALTQEEAIEIVLERMADMFEVLNSTPEIGNARPIRPDDEPPHITLVRWSPVLSDYAAFAKRANHALEKVEGFRKDRDQARSKAWDQTAQAKQDAQKAIDALHNAKAALREALDLLDQKDGGT